jgi:hypothetical protein
MKDIVYVSVPWKLLANQVPVEHLTTTNRYFSGLVVGLWRRDARFD